MRIDIYNASELGRNQWRQLQGISRSAFMGSIMRDQVEIDRLVAWEDSELFYKTHTNPNILVGNYGYNLNQEFTKARVAVAHDGERPFGFAYTAHNVSGDTELKRQVKKLSIVKNYLWFRDIAVLPGHQRQGIAEELGKKLLSDAISFQPVSAYIWPEEVAGIQDRLEKLGFSETGDELVDIFGTGEEVVQRRMQASTVKSVLDRL
jgi:GNAT superfamily N-acetyltransferase